MNTAHRTDREVTTANESLFISVVVPIRNEADFIGETLRSLATQDYPVDRFEVLVVDGRSTDNTRKVVEEISRRYSNVRLLDNPRLWSSAARNIGVQESQGEIITIVDGHCDLCSDQYLVNLSNAFLRSDADIVGRPQLLNVEDATPIQQAIAIARASRLGHHPDSFIYSGDSQFVPASSVGAAYRREVFDRIGLFDETFDACEDVELNSRADNANERCYFTKDVEIRYHPRASLSGLFKQMSRYGCGRVRLARKHPRTGTIKSFIPGVFVAGLLLGPIGAALHPVFAVSFMAAIVTYVLIVIAATMWLGFRSKSLSHLWRLPMIFATIHIGAGWGVLREFVLGERSPRSSVI